MTDTRTFRCQPGSVTAARGFVRDLLRDYSRETVDAAELMTSELATNCVKHANTDFELIIDLRDEIRVEVRDTGRGRPLPRSPTPQEPSGRGLRIVEAMSSSWGIVPSSSGKSVWFTLAAQTCRSSAASQSLAASGRACARSGETEGRCPKRSGERRRHYPRSDRRMSNANRLLRKRARPHGARARCACADRANLGPGCDATGSTPGSPASRPGPKARTSRASLTSRSRSGSLRGLTCWGRVRRLPSLRPVPRRQSSTHFAMPIPRS